MSIWSSVQSGTIKALNGSHEDANYNARGEPGLEVDVATAVSWHDHIRLAIWGDRKDVTALLSPDAALQLAKRLEEAARETTATGTNRPTED